VKAALLDSIGGTDSRVLGGEIDRETGAAVGLSAIREAVPLSRQSGLSSKGLYCPEAFYFFFFSCLGAE